MHIKKPPASDPTPTQQPCAESERLPKLVVTREHYILWDGETFLQDEWMSGQERLERNQRLRDSGSDMRWIPYVEGNE